MLGIEATDLRTVKVLTVLVIGPSGIGKSTLLRAALKGDWPGGLEVQLMPKETTRKIRGPAEKSEMTYASRDEFSARLSSGYYSAHYETFGEIYGVPAISWASIRAKTIVMQTFPTKTAVQLKLGLRDVSRVVICLLEADESVVRQRLLKRGDTGTRQTLDERMQTFGRQRRPYADVVIDANGTAQEVFDVYRAWVSSLYLESLAI